MPASSLRLIELFISKACAVQATYSFLYVDHGLSQSLRFLPKGSQARGTRLAICKFYINLYGNFPLLKFSWLLQEKMCNSCVAAGCSNVSNLSKNVSVHKYNDSEKKRGRLWRLVRTRQAKRGNGLSLIHRLSGFR